MPEQVIFHEYGDAALLVDIPAETYLERWDIARRLGHTLRAVDLPGLIDVVSTYENVVVIFDPLVTDSTVIRSVVTDQVAMSSPVPQVRRFLVPAVYGDEYGPDLADVARELSLTPSELIALHSSHDWTVRFTGSPVGAPYMDGVPLPRAVARMRAPRVRVAPGSVAMSGVQSSIYPAASPGGWRLIARTPTQLFDLDSDPPMAYAAGDLIRFVPIDIADWDHHALALEPQP